MESHIHEVKTQVHNGELVPRDAKTLYLESKERVVARWKPYFRSTIDNNVQLFSGTTEQDKDLLSEGLALFLFGVERIHKRSGKKRADLNLTFSPTGLKNGHMVGIIYDSPIGEIEYGVDPKELVKAVKSRDMTGRLQGRFAGLERPYFGDMMEIAGVEEGDHFLFLRSKKSEGRPGVVNRGLGYEYYTSDIEYHALLKKIDFCRQFKPQYVDDLELTQFQAKKAREQAGYYQKNT